MFDFVVKLQMQIQKLQLQDMIMTLPSTAIALIAVFIIGYLAAVSVGTWAYFANEKEN